MNVPYLSASRIKCFQQCELKYHAQYDLGIRDEVSHPLTHLGSAVHKVFEISTNAMLSGRRKYLWNPHDLLPSVFAKYGVLEEYHQLAHDLVQNGIDWGYFDNLHEVVGCEVKVEIKLPDGTGILGFIDRLDLSEDGKTADIIDLKTQKKAYSDNDLKKDWQAKIYNYAVRKLIPSVENVNVSFWVLRHRVQQVERTSFDANTAETELMEIGQEIKNCDAPNCTLTYLCNWCPYQFECHCKSWKDRDKSIGLKQRFKNKIANTMTETTDDGTTYTFKKKLLK